MALGEQIRRMRENRGMTLTELARSAGVSKAYLSQLETERNSHPSAEIVLGICRSLGCSVEVLLGAGIPELEVPETAVASRSLRTLAREENLDSGAIQMLSGISYNGRQPTSVEGWRIILQAIRESTEGV